MVMGIRHASRCFGWRTQEPRDYSDVVASAVARPVKSVARRVRPPKGKIERERERKTAYDKLRRLWRAPGSTSPLPPAAGGLGKAGASDVTAPFKAVEQASDPSDRIIVNREELRRFIDSTGGSNDEDERDPFEPRS